MQATGLKDIQGLWQPLKAWRRRDLADDAAEGAFFAAYDDSVDRAGEALSAHLERICMPSSPWVHDATMQTMCDKGATLLTPTTETVDMLKGAFDHTHFPAASTVRGWLARDRAHPVTSADVMGTRRFSNVKVFYPRAIHVPEARVGRALAIQPSDDDSVDAARRLAAGQVFDPRSGTTLGICMAGPAPLDTNSIESARQRAAVHARMVDTARASRAVEPAEALRLHGAGLLSGRCVSYITTYVRGDNHYLAGLGDHHGRCDVDTVTLIECGVLGAIAPLALTTALSPASTQLLTQIGQQLDSLEYVHSRLVPLPGSACVEWRCCSLDVGRGIAVLRATCNSALWNLWTTMAVAERADLHTHEQQTVGAWLAGAKGLHAFAMLAARGQAPAVPLPELYHMAVDAAWLADLRAFRSGAMHSLLKSTFKGVLTSSFAEVVGHFDCRASSIPEMPCLAGVTEASEMVAWEALTAAQLMASDRFTAAVERRLQTYYQQAYRGTLPELLAVACNLATPDGTQVDAEGVLARLEGGREEWAVQRDLPPLPAEANGPSPSLVIPSKQRVLNWARGLVQEEPEAAARMGVVLCAAVCHQQNLDAILAGAAMDPSRGVCMRIQSTAGAEPLVLLLRMDAAGSNLRGILFGKRHPVACVRTYGQDENGHIDPTDYSDREIDMLETMLSLLRAYGREGNAEKYRSLIAVCDAIQRHHHQSSSGGEACLAKVVAQHLQPLLAIDAMKFLLTKGVLKQSDVDRLSRRHGQAWGTCVTAAACWAAPMHAWSTPATLA